eukprot:TRINITY_DN1700_c3_g2_i2.p1 TRINITY_DN1700_c3_g2~~TRINITY_DN1700_c3_g2_i2.p1  ORF type:complete len:334 (+),score=21.25 TRINITY_DN1700_c3_g2_i2:68-1069(+)
MSLSYVVDEVLKIFFVIVWIMLLITLIILTIVFEGRNPWGDQIWAYHPWCEEKRYENLLIEPSSTYSDFGFLAVGLFQIYCACHDYLVLKYISNKGRNEDRENKTLFTSSRTSNFITNQPIISLTMGFINIVHFFGTALNHACSCLPGQQLDEAGMFCVTAMPVIFNSYYILNNKQNKMKSALWSFLYIFIIFPSAYLLTKAPFYSLLIRESLMIVLVISSIYTTVIYFRKQSQTKISNRDQSPRSTIQSTLFRIAIICVIFGFSLHTFDRYNKFFPFSLLCYPTSIIQLHALWHIFTGTALLCIYLIYRTENSDSISKTFLKISNEEFKLLF